MNTHSTNQEILLFTATGLTGRSFCEKNSEQESSILNPAEQLEKACWEGMLTDILSNILIKDEYNGPLYLWHVDSREEFLHLSLGTSPLCIDHHDSIDPYFFMEFKKMN